MFGYPVNVHPQFLTLPNLQPSRWPIFGVGNQQILDLLVVDLYHADGNLIQLILLLVSVYSVENLFACQWNYSPIDSVPDH